MPAMPVPTGNLEGCAAGGGEARVNCVQMWGERGGAIEEGAIWHSVSMGDVGCMGGYYMKVPPWE